MRLLVITNNPERASFRQRVGVYLPEFAAHGIAAEVEVLPKGYPARRRLFKRAAEFDAVFLHKKKLNRLDARALRRCSRRIIYNFDDAIMYSSKRPERHSRSHALPFRRTVRLADAVIVGSNYLARQATPFNPNVHVLPLGLDIEDYRAAEHPASDDTVRLVWIGSESTLEYLEEIRPVLEQVTGRFDNTAVRVICDTFPDWPSIATEEIPWSPENRRNKLATADIGLAPLPDNRFTQGKCSFKVLEYSASGLPVVASPVGTNAEYVREGETGFLVNSTAEWVGRISRLIEHQELRSQMGRAGRKHAESFDVKIIADRFCELVKRVAAGG